MTHHDYNKPLRPISDLLLELQDIDFQIYKYCNTPEYTPSAEDGTRMRNMHDIAYQIRVLVLALKDSWEDRGLV